MESEGLRRCAITGASGYIGGYVARYLHERGMYIIPMGRTAPQEALAAKVVPFTLGQPVEPHVFEDVDILIHCAYDFKLNRWEEIKRINVDGAVQLFEAAALAGVKKMICISSIASFVGCRSLYGKAKLMVEQAGGRLGVRAIRPALVFDNAKPGGIVGALNSLISRTALIPLIGNGEQIFYPCHIDDLVHLIYVLCTSAELAEVPQVITAASQAGLTFREVLLRLAAAKGKQIHFFPVPYHLVLFGLQTLERLGVKSLLRSDALISILNQNPQVDFSGLELLERQGCSFRPFLGQSESTVPSWQPM